MKNKKLLKEVVEVILGKLKTEKNFLKLFHHIQSPELLKDREIWHLNKVVYEEIPIHPIIDIVAIVKVSGMAKPHYHDYVDTVFFPLGSKYNFPKPKGHFILGTDKKDFNLCKRSVQERLFYVPRQIVHGLQDADLYYLTVHIGRVIKSDKVDVVEQPFRILTEKDEYIEAICSAKIWSF